jgi:hypothetical protein
LIFNYFSPFVVMVQFYKLLAADLRHYDFIYHEGLNVDTMPFDPSGNCEPGGLYFTTFEYIPKWYSHHWPLIADVALPDDARVYTEPCGTKWKADRLVLSNIRPLSEFLATLDETTLNRMITEDCMMLEHVKNQTEALCLAAVQQDGGVLDMVQNQTNAICLAAVQQEGLALEYVRRPTESICRAALQQNPKAKRFMLHKLLAYDLRHHDHKYTEGLNVDHVPFDPSGQYKPGGLSFTTFRWIPLRYDEDRPLIADVTLPEDARVYEEPCGACRKTDQLVLSNIRPLSEFLATLDEAKLRKMLLINGRMLQDVVNQTDALCLAAVQQDGLALKYVENQTDAICLAAVQRCAFALCDVRNQTDAICMAAVQKYGCALQYVRNPTEAIYRAAVKQNPMAKKFIQIPLGGKYYKLLAANRCHHGFTYQEGWNVDPLPFDPSGDCKPGGLYYTTLEHLPKWYDPKWPLIADVALPQHARVYAEPCGTKWKADRLVLSNIRPLSEFLATLDEATLRQMLAQDGRMIKHVHNQTEALCIVAVQQNAWALQYVRKRTDAIHLAAVQQNGYALQFVWPQTDAICLAAVQQTGLALKYVQNQTEALCSAAVRQNVYALEYVTVNF